MYHPGGSVGVARPLGSRSERGSGQLGSGIRMPQSTGHFSLGSRDRGLCWFWWFSLAPLGRPRNCTPGSRVWMRGPREQGGVGVSPKCQNRVGGWGRGYCRELPHKAS